MEENQFGGTMKQAAKLKMLSGCRCEEIKRLSSLHSPMNCMHAQERAEDGRCLTRIAPPNMPVVFFTICSHTHIRKLTLLQKAVASTCIAPSAGADNERQPRTCDIWG